MKMTEREYGELVNKYGQIAADKLVGILDNYKGSTGKKYKSDYRAILSWVVDKYLKERKERKSETLGYEVWK